MEEQLPAGLGEGKIAEFIEDDEVEPGKMIGNAALPAGTGLGLEPVDEVDDVEEAPACATADERTGNGDRQMRLAGACPADQDDIVLIGDEGAGGEVAHEGELGDLARHGDAPLVAPADLARYQEAQGFPQGHLRTGSFVQ